MSTKNPVLDLPLSSIMRMEIALPLQHVLQLHTVGAFLKAWRNPKNHRSIEQIFDSPEQARHAVGICAAWLGLPTAPALPNPMPSWWINDKGPAIGLT